VKRPTRYEAKTKGEFWAVFEWLVTLLGRMDAELEAQDKSPETTAERMKRLDIRSLKGGKA